MRYNMEHFEPPLPLAEVNVIARQLQRRDYAYKCNDAPINDHCDRERCLTRRYGVGNVGTAATVANLRKYNSKPPIWFMDVNGEPLELDTDALQNQGSFQKSCIEQLNVMPPTVSKPVWENRVAALLRDMTETEGGVIEASTDASIDGAFYEYLEDFCRNMQTAADKEEILLRRPWTDEENDLTFFRLKDFESYLKRQRFLNLKHTALPSVYATSTVSLRCFASRAAWCVCGKSLHLKKVYPTSPRQTTASMKRISPSDVCHIRPAGHRQNNHPAEHG